MVTRFCVTMLIVGSMVTQHRVTMPPAVRDFVGMSTVEESVLQKGTGVRTILCGPP
jgi:hypothetical protein